MTNNVICPVASLSVQVRAGCADICLLVTLMIYVARSLTLATTLLSEMHLGDKRERETIHTTAISISIKLKGAASIFKIQ
jgi:hypothetical protein